MGKDRRLRPAAVHQERVKFVIPSHDVCPASGSALILYALAISEKGKSSKSSLRPIALLRKSCSVPTNDGVALVNLRIRDGCDPDMRQNMSFWNVSQSQRSNLYATEFLSGYKAKIIVKFPVTPRLFQ